MNKTFSVLYILITLLISGTIADHLTSNDLAFIILLWLTFFGLVALTQSFLPE